MQATRTNRYTHPSMPALQRFLRDVVQNGECWRWTGRLDRGYGLMHLFNHLVREPLAYGASAYAD